MLCKGFAARLATERQLFQKTQLAFNPVGSHGPDLTCPCCLYHC
jgi:hypothetical protein